VFDKSETRKIIQHKRQELSADCGVLHNEELRLFAFLTNKMGRTCGTFGGEKNARKILMRKCE